MSEKIPIQLKEQKTSFLLSREEIFDIDDRIKECSFENPDSLDSEFYIKVWFNYVDERTMGQGRHEFNGLTKSVIIDEVKTFFRDKNKGYEIVF